MRPAFGLSVAALLLAACAGPAGPLQVVTLPAPPRPAPEALQYRIRPEDTLSVKFLQNPELSESVQVRQDGKVSLPLIGDLVVAGLTTTQLRSELSLRYTAFIQATQYSERIREGDEIRLRFWFHPELDQTVSVQPDGRIALPLIGEVRAAGLTATELKEAVTAAYRRDLKAPDITIAVTPKKIFAGEADVVVTVAKFAQHQVFVGGEVGTPNIIRFEGSLTALQAIMQVGGLKETADLGRVVVLRRLPDGEVQWIQSDLLAPLRGERPENDLALTSGDVLVVPRTGIAELDLFVKQYIRDLIPIPFSVSQ
jgi:polysaccharide export outer membrane protein